MFKLYTIQDPPKNEGPFAMVQLASGTRGEMGGRLNMVRHTKAEAKIKGYALYDQNDNLVSSVFASGKS